ncbi:hypothetical protein Z946_3179 [Sulfitobacter noctilucicola]|nr:hypothetical protein Z946_3179 [Sulfitobacter noctilucicola]
MIRALKKNTEAVRAGYGAWCKKGNRGVCIGIHTCGMSL